MTPSAGEPRGGAEPGAEELNLGRHATAIRSVALSSDGELAATTADDGVRVWRIRTGEPVLRLLLPPDAERRHVVAAWGSDGRTLIAAGGCALRRYDLERRRALAPIPFAPATSSEDPLASGAAPGPRLDGGGSATDADGGSSEEGGPPPCDDAHSIAVAPDDDLVVVTTSSGLLRRFSLARQRELEPLVVAAPGPYGFVDGVSRPVISADGAWVAVGVGSVIHVMNAAGAEPRTRVLTGWERLADLDFAPTGAQLAVLTDERVAIIDVSVGKLLRSTSLKHGIHVGGSLRHTTDGRRLLVLANDELVALDADSAVLLGTVVSEIDDGIEGPFGATVGGLWVHPDGKVNLLVRQLPSPR